MCGGGGPDNGGTDADENGGREKEIDTENAQHNKMRDTKKSRVIRVGDSFPSVLVPALEANGVPAVAGATRCTKRIASFFSTKGRRRRGDRRHNQARLLYFFFFSFFKFISQSGDGLLRVAAFAGGRRDGQPPPQKKAPYRADQRSLFLFFFARATAESLFPAVAVVFCRQTWTWSKKKREMSGGEDAPAPRQKRRATGENDLQKEEDQKGASRDAVGPGRKRPRLGVAHTRRGSDQPDDHGGTSGGVDWNSLPPEIVATIAAAIAAPRDLAAWATATGAHVPQSVWAASVASLVGVRAPAHLARRVPPAILFPAWERAAPEMDGTWTQHEFLAAAPVNVVEWICARLPAPPQLSTACFPAPWSDVVDAVEASRPAAAAVMVDHLEIQGLHVGHPVFKNLLKNALEAGDIQSFARLHRHRPRGMCPCNDAVGQVLLRADDVDTLDAACAVCPSVLAPSETTIIVAVRAGAARILRWLLDRAVATGQLSKAIRSMGGQVLDTALARDDVPIIECIDGAGVWGRIGDALLVRAGQRCALKIMAWAAGETRAAGPITAWPSAAPAYGAACCSRPAESAAVFAWLLARPDATRTITPGVLRLLIENDHADDVATVHDSGVALIDAERACEAAIVACCRPSTLNVLVDRGARCGAAAWAAALARHRADSLVYIKDRCGTTHLQEALDCVMAKCNRVDLDSICESIAWVRAHVPEACVRSAILAAGARHAHSDHLVNLFGMSCGCAQCEPPPVN